MYKSVNFNIYKENLEQTVFRDRIGKPKEMLFKRKNEIYDKPIPKPAPDFLKFPLSYKKHK